MSYSIGLSLTYLTYQTVFRILACCQKCQAILLSYCWIIIYWYINHIVFIHSSVDGHLGCFCILNIVNKAAVSVGVYIFLKNTVFIPLGMYSIVELLDYVVDLLLTFLGTFILFSMLWNQFIFPSVVYEGSFFFNGILARTCSPMSFRWWPFWQVWGDNISL